jgi:hypothetical protein
MGGHAEATSQKGGDSKVSSSILGNWSRTIWLEEKIPKGLTILFESVASTFCSGLSYRTSVPSRDALSLSTTVA